MGRYRVKRVSVTKTPRRKRAGAKRNPTARNGRSYVRRGESVPPHYQPSKGEVWYIDGRKATIKSVGKDQDGTPYVWFVRPVDGTTAMSFRNLTQAGYLERGAKNPTARRRNGEFDNLTYSLVQSAAGAGRASGKEWGTGKPTTTRMDKEFRHWFEYRRDTFNLGVLNAAEKKQLRGSFFAGVRAGYQSKPNPYRVSRKRKAAVAKRTGAALAKYVRRRRNSKTGAGGWPLVPSTRFPGESTLACPKCGSTNVSMSVHYGPGGRLGDPGALQYNRCGNCGHQTHYKAGKSNPRRKAAAAGYTIRKSGDNYVLCFGGRPVQDGVFATRATAEKHKRIAEAERRGRGGTRNPKGKAKRFTVSVTRGGKSFKLTVAAASLAAAKRAAAGWRP